jgi:hypothetical protein
MSVGVVPMLAIVMHCCCAHFGVPMGCCLFVADFGCGAHVVVVVDGCGVHVVVVVDVVGWRVVVGWRDVVDVVVVAHAVAVVGQHDVVVHAAVGDVQPNDQYDWAAPMTTNSLAC